jgi:hypothetical protein
MRYTLRLLTLDQLARRCRRCLRARAYAHHSYGGAAWLPSKRGKLVGIELGTGGHCGLAAELGPREVRGGIPRE